MNAKEQMLQMLFKITEEEFPYADVTTKNDLIRISQKTLDDQNRESKRTQPIIIKLHEDFFTSKLAQRSRQEIGIEFTAFIRKVRAQFNPRTTDDVNDTHTPDEWIFPPEC